jgi:hypothetical protein
MADRREIFDTLVLYLVFAAVLFKQENTKGKCKKKAPQNKKREKQKCSYPLCALCF